MTYRLLFLILTFFVIKANAQSSRIQRQIKKENFEKAQGFAEEKLANSKGVIKNISYNLSLAELNEKLGNYAQAGDYYSAALKVIEDKIELGKNLNLVDYDVIDEISLFYIKTGNLVRASYWIEYSLKNRVGKFLKNNPTNFRPYLAKGLLFYHQNQTDSAEKYLSEYLFNIRNSNYTKHLEVDKYADGYQSLSELTFNRGDLQKAQRYSKRATRLQGHSWTRREAGKNTIKRVAAMNTLTGIYLAKGRRVKAQNQNDQAYKLYLRNMNSDLPVMAELLVHRAELHLLKKDIYNVKKLIIEASQIETDYIRTNFPVLSEYEKENFQVRHKRLFNSMNYILVRALNDSLIRSTDPFWGKVLDFNTRTKGLILNESSRLYQYQRLMSEYLKEDLDAWKRLKNEYAYRVSSAKYKKETAKLDSLENQISRLERTLLQAIGPSSVDSLRLDDVVETLLPGDKIIEIVRVDTSVPIRIKGGWKKDERSTYLSLIIGRKGFERVNIIENGWSLENRYINNYSNSINFKVVDTVSYSAFWKVLDIENQGFGRVFVSPDGIYNLINFDNILNPKTGKYLFEEFDFINITNTRRLSDPFNKKAELLSNACLIGNPKFNEFPSPVPLNIPETALEINEVEIQINRNGGMSTVLMGKEATEKAVKNLRKCSLLHLATHGVFKRKDISRNPMMNSGLILTLNKNDDEDGILTAYEASALDLTEASIVVLSACDTGLGELHSGEGVYGLQRAFEVNGVYYTLMSMWKVDDKATREFMKFFYGALLNGKKSPHNALQEAQSKLKEIYAEPYFWGAFKLIGFRLE